MNIIIIVVQSVQIKGIVHFSVHALYVFDSACNYRSVQSAIKPQCIIIIILTCWEASGLKGHNKILINVSFFF